MIHTELSKPKTLQIPADLMLLLRREALSDYSMACDRARIVAEYCVAATNPSDDALGDLRSCRARVGTAEEGLDLLGAGAGGGEALDVSLNGRRRDLIAAHVRIALDRISTDFESSEQEILEAADTIQRLSAMRDTLASR